jgi:hypothetical protein
MASSKKKREMTPYPDSASLDSFPVRIYEGDFLDSDDIVKRAAKKRKMEELGELGTHRLAQSSQSSSGEPVVLDSFDICSPVRPTVTVPIGDTLPFIDPDESENKTITSRTPSASFDILSDPSFSFPPGPIRENSLPIVLVYDIDGED